MMKLRSLMTVIGIMGTIAYVPIVRSVVAQITSAKASESSISTAFGQEIDCDDIDETNLLYDSLEELNLSEEQFTTYYALFEEYTEEKEAEVYSHARQVEDPNLSLSFSYKEEFFNPDNFTEPDVPAEIREAIEEIINSEAMPDQKDALNEEFGQYGTFYAAVIMTLTPEQENQLDQISRDFYNKMTVIMTPEQLPRYRAILADQVRIDEACDLGSQSSYQMP